MLTSAAIILHEIPHEVFKEKKIVFLKLVRFCFNFLLFFFFSKIGDYAILIKAGFNRERAIKGQLLTSFGG